MQVVPSNDTSWHPKSVTERDDDAANQNVGKGRSKKGQIKQNQPEGKRVTVKQAHTWQPTIVLMSAH